MNQFISGLMAVLMFFCSLFGGFAEEGEEKRTDPEPSPAGEVTLRSRYSGMETGASSIRTEDGEALFARPGSDGGFWYNGNVREPMERLKDEAAANAVTHAGTLDAADVTALQVNASLCGVAVEPSQSGDFELSTVGLSNGLTIAVETERNGGTLTLTCTGTVPEAVYVNTGAAFRVNTVRLGVPAGVLKEIGVDCGSGSILVDGLDVPVTGVETSGLIRVTGEKRIAPVELHCANGCVAVQAEEIGGDVTMSAENGSVWLSGGAVTGAVNLTAQNGSVYARADRLENADLRAINGMVEAQVGVVGERAHAEVKNGMLTFQLTREPEDLTFRLSGGWRQNSASGHWEDDDWVEEGEAGGLPAGWYDGYTVGTGRPVLELSAASNGMLDLKVG